MSDEHSAEFKISITQAMADQLMATLGPLDRVILDKANLEATAERPGVYEIFLHTESGDERLYVGKAAKSLRKRLEQHRRKISGRVGIDPNAMRFICAYVDEDLDAAAPEKMLIKRYRDTGSVPWNTNGFGNNDPGRNRDTTLVKTNHFDALYRINLDQLVEVTSTCGPAFAILDAIKTAAPYNVRYDRLRKKPHPDLVDTTVTVPAGAVPVRELLPIVVEQLPIGWQATAFPGYVILYPEPAEKVYASAMLMWRRNDDGVVIETPGLNRRKVSKRDIPEDDASESDVEIEGEEDE
ncbi:hypothetical protein ABIA35_004199 [Catenulispora sp. MAP12-49]|uniref:GIY-YIG nuclease family protein n=1 Tax=Catenulispora sp. MAP12-49 TaxID=3156302 RepID=UPI0035129309